MTYRNEVELVGTLLEKPYLHHSAHGMRFYQTKLGVSRMSGKLDEIILTLGEEKIDPSLLQVGARIALCGALRSFNNKSGTGRRLHLSVLVRDYCAAGARPDENRVTMAGVLCTPPVRRCTPLGREICDLMLAVDRKCGRADYIPCIAWGSLAAVLGEGSAGAKVAFEGRLQSRAYQKVLEDRVEERVAYEASVMRLLL